MTRKDTDGFIQEYLYIEEVPLHIYEEHKSKKENKTDESTRGFEVISLFGDEEDEIQIL